VPGNNESVWSGVLWAWRGLLAATLAWSVLAFSGVAIVVIAAWVATEISVRRQRGRD
jgi:hypothetical protein